MIKITDAILPVGHTSRPGGSYEKTTVTIHETGNPNKGAGAYNHALYARNRTDKLGAHYYADDQSIYRTIPDAEAANHSGSTTGNKYSIAIEICINPDSNFSKACDNAADLAAKLLHERGLSAESLRQHYNWNGKDCPATLRKSGWAAFSASVQKKINAMEAPKSMEFVKVFKSGEIEKIQPVMAEGGKTETIDSVKARTGADYVINLQAFNTKTYVTDGALTVDGYTYSTGRCGHGFAFRGGEWKWSYLNNLKWPHFAGGFGLLLKNGEKNIINPHTGMDACTALGITADGSLVMYLVGDGDPAICTTDELVGRMASYGCTNAIRMDGGGSTQGRGPGLDIRTTRPVQSYLCIWLKKPDPNKPADWAKDAVDWAVKNKLIVGDASGDLKLQEPVTVEQMITVLYRYHAKNNG